MNHYEAQTFLKVLLDDGYIRALLERSLGYDLLHEIREGINSGDYRQVQPLIEYLKSVCQEVEEK